MVALLISRGSSNTDCNNITASNRSALRVILFSSPCRDKEKQSRIYDTNADDTDMDVDVAATNLQRIGTTLNDLLRVLPYRKDILTG